MSTTPNDGGPMAAGMLCSEGVMTPIGGLSKREYFAAMALQGLLANANYGAPDPTSDALVAVREADALLVALSKEAQS